MTPLEEYKRLHKVIAESIEALEDFAHTHNLRERARRYSDALLKAQGSNPYSHVTYEVHAFEDFDVQEPCIIVTDWSDDDYITSYPIDVAFMTDAEQDAQIEELTRVAREEKAKRDAELRKKNEEDDYKRYLRLKERFENK